MLKTKKVANVANQIPVILGCPFLITANALINCRNEIMRLSFGNMTLKLNIFNHQRQPLGFVDLETSRLNWVKDSNFDDKFNEMFVAEYESFLIDDEPEYDVFQFDDLCSTSECAIFSTSEHDSPFVSLDLKLLPDSLKYSFWNPMILCLSLLHLS